MVDGARRAEQSCTASKVRHVVHRLLATALLLVVACHAHDARAQVARRASEQRERARAALAAEPAAPTPVRGDWYGWQTLTADALSLAMFVAGGADSAWRRRLIDGAVLGYATATPIIHLVHRRRPQALVSVLVRVLGTLAAHGLCDSFGKIEFDISLGPSSSDYESPSKGFYRSLDDQLGPDAGAGTVCAGLTIATIITLDAVAFAYDPPPGEEPEPRERRNIRSPRRLQPRPEKPRIAPKLMLDERGWQAGLELLGTF
jgi:hypothetical protein